MRRAVMIAVALGCLAAPLASAHADVYLGLDAQLGVPVGDAADAVDPAAGGDIRLGYELPIPALRIAPELAASMVNFPDGTGSANPDHEIRTISGGLRAGLSGPLAPSLYAHVGWGWIDGEAGDMVLSRSGLTTELGAAFDFTLLPFVTLGVHAALQQIRYDANRNDKDWGYERWVKVGAHAELSF